MVTPGYLQLCDWQAYMKLSHFENSSVKQVLNEGSPFKMKDSV